MHQHNGKRIILTYEPMRKKNAFHSTRIAPGACKTRHKCNVLQVLIQNSNSLGTKVGEPFSPWRIKIVMACFRTILKDEAQTIGISPLRFSSPTLNLTYLPTYLHLTQILSILRFQIMTRMPFILLKLHLTHKKSVMSAMSYKFSFKIIGPFSPELSALSIGSPLSINMINTTIFFFKYLHCLIHFNYLRFPLCWFF